MAMKLYYGGFGDYNEFVVADSEEQAILKVGIKINAPFLPIKVNEITEIDGFTIQPVATSDEKPVEVEEVEIKVDEISNIVDVSEIKVEIPLRHCKKCDFTCETQGQLLAHYREIHTKGD